MYTNIDHVVLVVRDLDKAVAVLRDQMGLTLRETRDIPRSKVRVAFFPIGKGNIEVIEPTDPESPPAKFLEEHGEGLYQLSLQVDDLDATLTAIQRNGIDVPRDDLSPPAGAGRRRAYPDKRATLGASIQLIAGPNRYAADS